MSDVTIAVSQPRRPGRRGRARPRWLVLCTLVMALLLPLQGIALSLDAALRPAHVHRHAAGCQHGSSPMLPSSGAVDAPGDRPGMITATAALADDTVLDYLPPGHGDHPHDAGGNDLGTKAGAVADSASGAPTAAAAHDEVGHHTHSPDDPDVVYVDDGRHDADGAVGGLGKVASDGMVMLQPTWPQALPSRHTRSALPAPLPRYATRHDVPPDRPPT